MTRRAAMGLVAMLAACGGAPTTSTDSPGDAADAPKESARPGARPAVLTTLCRADAIADCERLCGDGAVLSCVRWGQMLESGTRTLVPDYPGADDRMPRAPALARRLYVKACDGGYAEACALAAQMLELEDTDGEPQVARARSLFERGCLGGSGTACKELARTVRSEGDERGAADLLAQACAFGAVSTCETGDGDDEPRRPRLILRARASGDRKPAVVCPPGTTAFRRVSEASNSRPERRSRTYCARLDTPTIEDGPFVDWYSLEDEAASNGVVTARGVYRDGRPDGPFEERDPLGVILQKGSYAAGLKDGVWLERRRDEEETYTYRAGKRHGPYKRVVPEQELVEEGQFDDDRRTGKWTTTRRGVASETVY